MNEYEAPYTRAETACDADPAKQELLAQAVAAALADGAPREAFALAVAIRGHGTDHAGYLADGLAEDDFDGVNIEAALKEDA